MSISYLFDFDGTLVDSMPTFVSTMLHILDTNHIPYSDDVVKTLTPLGLNGTAEYFIHELGLDMPKEQLIQEIKDLMLDAYWHHIPAKPNVIAVLEALKQQGASLNILTASPHITLDACLKRLGMWELFDHVWSCDDFDTTKADPGIYQKVAQALDVPIHKILFLDDNLNADITAKSAGMLTCGVYDESSRDYVEQMKAANDFYIYDFTQLLQINPKA